MSVRLAAGVALFAMACANDPPRASRTEDEHAALGGEVAARVGAQAIPLQMVASVAESQELSPREAVRRLVDDEIAAAAARAQGREKSPPTSWRLVSARARLTTEELARQARSLGPPTDEEVKLLSARHWVEFDRPPSVRVVHAIVLRPKNAVLLPAARTAAAAMHEALAQASTEDFEAKAKATPHDPKLELRVERLPAMTEEGRVAEGAGTGQMDPIFAKAASALEPAAPTSAVVETPFGFHVIRLLERVPERRVPIEERRLAFEQETYVMRVRDLLNARLKALRDAHPVVISPAAETLMRGASVSRETAEQP